MTSKEHESLVEHWSKNDSFMDRYWKNEDLIDGSRKLAKIMNELRPKSIFEVGMYNGRNIFYAKELMPSVKFGGVDVNSSALDFAKNVLSDDVDISLGDALYMSTDDKYDIVFTHGVLMHISPDTIGGVVDRCIAKSNNYIIHIERKEENNYILRGSKSRKPERVDEQLRWCPNIAKMYEDKGHDVVQNSKSYFGSKQRKSRCIIIKVNK